MVGAREEEWVSQINAIATATGRLPAEVVQEAIASQENPTLEPVCFYLLNDHNCEP